MKAVDFDEPETSLETSAIALTGVSFFLLVTLFCMNKTIRFVKLNIDGSLRKSYTSWRLKKVYTYSKSIRNVHINM